MQKPSRRKGRARSGRQHVAEHLEPRRLLATFPAGFTETLVADGVVSPTAMAVTPDGRVFVCQQRGEIRVIKNNSLLSTNFATVNENSQNDRGLLGIAFDPQFTTNGYVYVYYTAASPTVHNRVSRFTANGDVAAGGETVIFDLSDVGSAIAHMGGALNFGGDGKLYISVGDFQDSGHAQSLNVTMGKVLRINKDGSIPTDNPFYNQTSGINRAIWVRGLRHVFHTAVQPGTGLLYLNDVGQDNWEEINTGVAGANYGWPNTEGDFNQSSFPSFTRPTYTYNHNDGCSIIGGAFYNPQSNTFGSQYAGKYFFSDFCGGWLKTIDPVTKSVSNFASGMDLPTAVVVAPDGALWYISRDGFTGGEGGLGRVFRIQNTVGTGPQIVLQPQSQTAAVGDNVTFTVSANGTAPLSYQWQRNNSNISGATAASYTRNSVTSGDNNAQFRCVVSNAFGSANSNAATLTITSNTRPVATITAPTASTTWAGNDVILYAGTGTDAQDGTLSGNAFTWQVDFHHDTHHHPFIAPTTGPATGSFTIPTTGETADNVWYRVYLTVRDSGGLTSTTVQRDIFPRKANLTLAANVPGLTVSLDGQPRANPTTVLGVQGISRQLDAPLTQSVGGNTYQFVGWSDGGSAQHPFTFPSADTTVTAFYRRVPVTTAYASDLSWVGTPTNGWGPVERDESNGENQSGDGDPITLNGVTYPKGLGVHASSSITYNLGGAYQRFLSDVGIDDESGNGGSVVFQVYADNVKIFDSGTMSGSSPTQAIDVNVAGIGQLRLVVTDAGNGNADDHGDWAGARLTGSATATPLTLNGTAANDTWTLRLNPGGTQLLVWQNAPTSGNPTQTIPITSIDTVVVNGLGGDDTLTLDALNGPFTGIGQITFDGGANGSSAGDLLRFLGTNGAETFDLAASAAYLAALPTTYSNVERVNVESGGADDRVNVNAATAAMPAFIGGTGNNSLVYNSGTHALGTDVGTGVGISVNNTAVVNATATQHVQSFSLSGNGRLNLTAGGSKVLRVQQLVHAGNGTLDLNDNDLVLDYSGASQLAAVQQLINRARNGGNWLGVGGITSSTARTAPDDNTTLAAIESADFLARYGAGALFAGESIDSTAVLVKYTWYGDADFSGTVNFDDYVKIDVGFNTSRTGWTNGDFNASGTVNFDDYVLIDVAFNTQDGVV